MKAIKRTRPQITQDSDSEDFTGFNDAPAHSDDEMNDAPSGQSSEEEEGEEEEDDQDSEAHYSSDEEPAPDSRSAIAQISFGTLAKAQASLSKDKAKTTKGKAGKGEEEAPSKAALALRQRREAAQAAARASKNAPQEVSSKRAVTRKREVVEVHKVKARDPRFDPAVNSRYDEHEFRKNYKFLEDYRESEMKMLKGELKKSKDERRNEVMMKKLKSMESQKQSQMNKDKVQEVIREHKKAEREKVKMGKKAYHLKASMHHPPPLELLNFVVADEDHRRCQEEDYRRAVLEAF
jgi:ribosomal RNA-processing protein 36